MSSYLFAAFFILALLPSTADAQSLGSGADSASFTVSARPQYPTPYGQATISLLSNTLDLANAVMTVALAGKEFYRGAVQPLSIPLGKAGSVTNVKVTISSNGVPYVQSIFIQPQDVVLVAEPISSAPSLYLGKPLIPLQGSVRVVAMANFQDARGKTLAPNTLSYAWSVDDRQIANSSGIGRTAILVASPLQYRARSVSVAVTSPNGSLVGGASLSLAAEEPSLRIYQNDALLGILFDHALPEQYAITGAEASLFAAPFSLPTTSGSPLLQWFLNGESAQTGSTITLRPSGNGEGTASLSVTASTGNSTTANTNLTLSFGAAKSFNLFGL
ncbi:MAG: hypothetical protein NT108_02005 [Candidatus Kaiserbacteria bacterium]|nr:hypothetical protein [Candidatus Kaiserbacteria bacterium]